MNTIIEEINYTFNVPDKLNNRLTNNNFAFFDIETTGFSRNKSKVILIGLLYPTTKGVKIIQLFANDLKEEKELLYEFINQIKNFDTLISFNGDTFDIPFLNDRFIHNSIDYKISKDLNLDILKDVRKNKDILNLDNCKLKTVEKKLNIYREDIINGKESVNLYFKYLKNKDSKIKSTILKHNYDDIYYLPKIMDIYNLIDKESKIGTSIILDNQKASFEIDIKNIKIMENTLIISGITNKLDFKSQIYYKDNYTFKWEPQKGLFQLILSINKGMLSTGKQCSYLNQKLYDFPYLLKDSSNYKLPKELILIKDNKKLIYKNIQSLFVFLIEQIFYNIYDK